MTTQLNRLINDVQKLEQYIERLEQKGKTEMIDKLQIKKQFLTDSVAEYQNSMETI